MNTLGTWTDLLVAAVVFLLAAAILLALAIGLLRVGMWALDRWIGERRFQALTLLLAVTGGLAALYQGRTSAVGVANQKARTLALAEDCVSGLVSIISFDQNAPMDINAVPIEKLRANMPLILSYNKTLSEITLSDMPSAFSMTTIVKARAYSGALVEKVANIKPGVATLSLQSNQIDLATCAQALKNEELRLYPLYQVGGKLIGVPIQFR